VKNPFLIDEPTCISFSGGRTSAYMLWKVLQENNGLPDQAIVCFANTGKEEEATLEFVRDCAVNWDVKIHWLEYQWGEDTKNRWRLVDFESASRNGEPFAEAIKARGYLPNPVARYCTSVLKIKPFAQYLKNLGDDWQQMVGIRADEHRRVVKIRNNPDEEGFSRIMPLADAGVTKEMVGEFWRNQSFDLGLPNMNGVTMHGNCDLCYLKGGHKILSLIQEKPSRAIWWAEMETLALTLVDKPSGAFFRSDRPSYASMIEFNKDQMNMFDPDENGISCFCGD
jgi:3'-phosphoadenosine 5'-phosphosulfate sulfotransferase (PAPS reductase)/FAD synthetase